MTNPAWRDLGIRMLSAAILTPISLLAIFYGALPWSIWLGLLVLGMGAEWAGLCGIRLRSWPGLLVPGCLAIAGVLIESAGVPAPGAAEAALWLGGLGFLVASAFIVARSRAGGTMLGVGIVYIGPAWLALLMLRAQPGGLRNLLFLAALVWAGDIGAYLMGRLVGGPRLAPSISPGKTWAGALGGTAAAVLAGAAAGWEQPVHAGCLALGLSVVAQVGDLFESAMKRHFGAKDSGWIIPGHGGLLDRLDGVLAAAPVAMLWSLLAGPHRLLWY